MRKAKICHLLVGIVPSVNAEVTIVPTENESFLCSFSERQSEAGRHDWDQTTRNVEINERNVMSTPRETYTTGALQVKRMRVLASTFYGSIADR